MTAEQKQAYEWAKNQTFQSVAARYAKILAELVDELAADRSPCVLCGYGGKHLEAPPCCNCPAHPKEAEKNEPLTLDELRKMDGEPVWVRVSNNWRESGVSEGWCLVRFHTSDDRVRVYIWDTRHGARFFAQQDLGISWWAYRHKPKGAADGDPEN